jgi:hypothetical protein
LALLLFSLPCSLHAVLHRSILGSRDRPPPQRILDFVTSTTELTVVGGDRYRVEGDVKDVERLILNAARGSIMEFAWLVEAETGERVGINPDHVVMIRQVSA